MMNTIREKLEAYLAETARQSAATGDGERVYALDYARLTEVRRMLETLSLPMIAQYTVGENTGMLYSISADYHLWLYRNPRVGILYVISGGQALYADTSMGERRFADTVLYQVGNAIKGNSMTYVIRLCDGSFVLIDGGVETNQEGLEKILDALNPTEKKHRIRGWILTHPHFDHVTIFANAAVSLAPEAVYLNFPDLAENAKRDTNAVLQNNLVHQTLADLRGKGCRIHKPYTGQRFSIGNLQWEVLYSQEIWTLSETMTTVNDASLVLRMSTESGKTVLFLADVMEKAGESLLLQYSPTSLKSDYVQIAHHAMFGSDEMLYKAIAPSACLWPVSASEYALYGENLPRNIYLRSLPIPHYISNQGGAAISL